MKVLHAVVAAVVAIVAGVSFAGSASGQNTVLKVNGATATDNSALVSVVAGTNLTFEVSNAAAANRPYGIFGALANNGATTGWFLVQSGGGKNPFPIITGVPTAVVEAAYGVDIVPDRSGNPNVKLNASGYVSLTVKVPSNLAGSTIYAQAVTLPVGSSTPDASNAVTVNFVAAANAARMLVSHSNPLATPVDQDHVEFGVLEFNGGDPTLATFSVPDTTLTNIKPDTIAFGDMNEWTSQFSSVADKARAVDWKSNQFGPAFNNDNHEYGRISLPRLAGPDGLFDTADDVPPRDLMRCYDNVTFEGFFLVINKGDNPYTPGTDYYPIPGTRKKDSITTTLNSWKVVCQVSPDGSRLAAIYDDSSAAAGFEPQMFLIATDGSKPFRDSGNNPVDIVNVTPGGTKNFNSANNARTTIFTNNRLWVARDLGVNADGDGRNDMTLFTVDVRAQQPIPVQVTVPGNTNYSVTPVVDIIAEKAMFVARGGGTTMCFLAGDGITLGTSVTPDVITKGDWYAVTEAKPTAAVNLTKFRLYGSAGTTVPKMVVPGEAYNGIFGNAAISPDGTRLAFVSQNSNENGAAAGEDDEIYLCSTLDTDGNGEGDDAGLIFDQPITTNARIDNRSVGNTLDNSHDLILKDANNLFFFYGIDNSTTTVVDRQMDVFHWDRVNSVLTDVTTPSKVPPITTAGTIAPEGFFLSPNLRYFFFARGLNAGTKTNLVGVDTQTKKAFNITGTEYSGATTGDTNNAGAAGENFLWHLSYAGGSFPSLCYFAAPLTATATNTTQVWLFDANFPTAAIQLTNDNSGATVEQVESLTGSPVSLACAWAWTRSTTLNADYEYQDLLYFFRDVLSDTTTAFTSTATLGGIDWVRAATQGDPTGAAPPALICSIGDVGTDQASDAEFYYFVLDGTTNYDFDNITGADAPFGHQVGTLALPPGVGGLPFTGFIQIYFADVN